jgi:hypothetical protein
MNLRQLSELKRWHVVHHDDTPLEYHAWDAVLTLWLLGCTGPVPALLLGWTWLELLCVPMFLAPVLYVRLRRWLHARGALRCDWLVLLR